MIVYLLIDIYMLGMPAAWMISSNAQEETIDYFLHSIRKQNPNVIPIRFMSDKDRGQMNAVRRRYPESLLLLCWWHVLHAWQQHFMTTHYPELWDLLKEWVCMTDRAEFDQCWIQIQKIAPASIVGYFQDNWIGDVKLWFAVYRQDRTIFEQSDTNMLVEV